MLAALAGYLLGSFPTAALVARLYGVDIRAAGSGNPGASNTLRVLGFKAALPVALFDIGKGALAVWLAGRLGGAAEPAGAAAIAGHVWPLFSRFKGGKGVAAAAGAMGMLAPAALGLCLPVFALAAWATRTAAAASLSAAAAFPLTLELAPRLGASAPTPGLRLFAWFTLGLLLFTHRGNLRRLRAGSENKF